MKMLATVVSLFFLALPGVAAERLAGLYPAIVDRVVDGDTVRAHVTVWLGMTLDVAVRVRGIDAPETHQPKCDRERELGEKAAARVAGLLPEGEAITLTDVSQDKYGGRVVARIRLAHDGRDIDLSTLMLDEGLAYQYDGGRKQSWCGEASR